MSQWRVADPDVFGCVRWLGSKNNRGYGIFWDNGKPREAHRVAWERENGPVPEGRELDHLCRRRDCVRVVHLAAVTRSENERLKSFKARMALKQCPQGHDLSANGAVTEFGGRVCRICSKG